MVETGAVSPTFTTERTVARAWRHQEAERLFDIHPASLMFRIDAPGQPSAGMAPERGATP